MTKPVVFFPSTGIFSKGEQKDPGARRVQAAPLGLLSDVSSLLNLFRGRFMVAP